MYKNWKLLSTKEREHLKAMGVFKQYGCTTTAIEELFKAQAKLRSIGSGPGGIYHSEPCWECRIIAKKLGYL